MIFGETYEEKKLLLASMLADEEKKKIKSKFEKLKHLDDKVFWKHFENESKFGFILLESEKNLQDCMIDEELKVVVLQPGDPKVLAKVWLNNNFTEQLKGDSLRLKKIKVFTKWLPYLISEIILSFKQRLFSFLGISK